MQHPKKRNILLTVKDLNRHKHAIQIDKIQTGDSSNNILIIQARELQNLMPRKKKRNSPEAKILYRPHLKENLLLRVWEEYLLIFHLFERSVIKVLDTVFKFVWEFMRLDSTNWLIIFISKENIVSWKAILDV